jgi:uncharacterized protein with ParB-like and HNH nuclease domain
MDKELHSLSKIFTERLYRIPDYQRGYAWTEKQLKDFWTDLLILEKRKNHYLGVLTLEEVPEKVLEQWKDDRWIIESKSYAPYYIVDGQQRLTTSIILIQALLEGTHEEQKLNYTTLGEIRKKFIFDSKDDGISRSYIFGYEKDNPSYEFLKTRIFNEFSETSTTLQETIYTHNLEYAKQFFAKKIESVAHTDKEEIYQKLTQHLLFNIYSISSDIDVFIAFETMNNRGKPLSHLELLKNRLIYLSTRFNVEEYEKEKLRHSINEAWKSVYHYLGKNKNNPLDDDKFLLNHFIIYFGKIIFDKEIVPDEDDEFFEVGRSVNRAAFRTYSKYLLEDKFTAKNIFNKEVDYSEQDNREKGNTTLTINDIYSYVQSLQQYVGLWYKIANPDDSDFSEEEKIWLDKLSRMEPQRSDSPVPPFVMVFFQKEKNITKRVKFLKSLEQLKFLGLLTRYNRYYTREENFLSLAIKLSKSSLTSDKVIKELEERHSEVITNKEFFKDVRIKFLDGFYNWRGILYFLYEYELNLQIQSKTKRVKLNWNEFTKFKGYDYKSVEHIYPQNARKECWSSKFSHYTTKERGIIRNSIGNLLPLSRPKNSSFSNKCFIQKISNEANTVGYRYGSYSEIEVTHYQDWTAKEILERGIKLLNFMEDRWNFPIGGNQEKIDFLNLGFVVDKENLSY